MTKFLFSLSLFKEYIANYIKTKLTYRADFWVEVASDLLFSAMNLIFIFVVFQHTPSLGDWSEAEVVFVYGYFMIPYGLFSTFSNLWNFSERYIVKGEMDRILTRPAGSLTQVCWKTWIRRPSSALLSALALWRRLGGSWDFHSTGTILSF